MSKCKYLREPVGEATWYSCKQDDFVVPDETFNNICKDKCEKCKLNGGLENPNTFQLH